MLVAPPVKVSVEVEAFELPPEVEFVLDAAEELLVASRKAPPQMAEGETEVVFTAATLYAARGFPVDLICVSTALGRKSLWTMGRTEG